MAGFIQGHEDLIYDNDYVHTTQEHVDSLFDNCREQLPVVPIRGWNNRGRAAMRGRGARVRTPC